MAHLDYMEWWDKFNELEKVNLIEAWKLKTAHYRKEWSNTMISHSPSTIRVIYSERSQTLLDIIDTTGEPNILNDL